jgi:hypothetical protein
MVCGSLDLGMTVIVGVGVQRPALPSPVDVDSGLSPRDRVAVTVQHIDVELVSHAYLRLLPPDWLMRGCKPTSVA